MADVPIWVEQTVDRAKPHVKLWHDQVEAPIAFVAPSDADTFAVEFSPEAAGLSPRVLATAKRELDFYLVEKGEPDPWAYAIYHCGTAANAHSSVSWSYVERGEQSVGSTAEPSRG